MKRFLTVILIYMVFTMPTLAYEKHYIKNNKGQTTGYTKTYSNGKTVQYNKKGQVEYTYKRDSNGKVTKYSKTGKKLETYK